MRDVHLNSQYVILFQNPRDRSQFGHFARQIEPQKSGRLIEAYKDATSRPYSHLLIDMKPETPEILRYRADTLSVFPTIYTINSI